MPFATAAGRSLAYEWIGEARPGSPTLVFLHEGLGSIRQWRDFPAKIAATTGCRALVYDRYGYGQSDVLAEPRRTVRFMHDEALYALPDLLRSLAVEKPLLIGHSDGASIALIHAGAGNAVLGVAAMAPHVFIEPVCLTSIEKAAQAFESTDLAGRWGAITAMRARRSTGGRTSGSIRNSRAGSSATTVCPRSAARCSPSRATTTNTAPWRSWTRSRGA